ncbi:MAG: DUF1440 domain-containing protein [Sphingomonas sp.]|nr:DUF1440 domain-containing protein [Sphingomonas sp.]
MKAASRDLIVGVVSGIAAAWVMNAFQNGWSAVSKSIRRGDAQSEASREASEPTTVKAADRVSGVVVGGPVAEPHRSIAGNAVHYAFGAYLGGFYALLASNFPNVRAGFGSLYGTAVWMFADEFLVPGAELSPPPRQVAPSTHVYAMVSHWVFGAALEGSRRAAGAALAAARRGRR